MIAKKGGFVKADDRLGIDTYDEKTVTIASEQLRKQAHKDSPE